MRGRGTLKLALFSASLGGTSQQKKNPHTVPTCLGEQGDEQQQQQHPGAPGCARRRRGSARPGGPEGRRHDHPCWRKGKKNRPSWSWGVVKNWVFFLPLFFSVYILGGNSQRFLSSWKNTHTHTRLTRHARASFTISSSPWSPHSRRNRLYFWYGRVMWRRRRGWAIKLLSFPALSSSDNNE